LNRLSERSRKGLRQVDGNIRIPLEKFLQTATVISMDVRKDYRSDCSGINAQAFHIGEENIPITAGIKKDGLLEAFDQARKSPASLEIAGMAYVVEDNGESIRRVSFSGLNA
jgi:hypothetical protein